LHKPEIEVISGELTCSENKANGMLYWNLVALRLYIEPAMGDEITFVFHRCQVTFEIATIVERTNISEIRIAPPYVYDSRGPRRIDSVLDMPMKPDSVTTAHTGSEMIFRGSGRGDLRGNTETNLTYKRFENSIAIIEAKLAYSHEEQQVLIRTELPWRRPDPNEERILSRWISKSAT